MHWGKGFPELRVCTELMKAVETVQAVMRFACCVFACASLGFLKWPHLSWVSFITHQQLGLSEDLRVWLGLLPAAPLQPITTQ